MFLSPFAKMKKLQEEQEKKLQEEGRREIYIRDFSSKLGVEISDGKYKPSEESNDSLEKELSSILKSDSPSLEDFSPLSNKKIPAQVYDEYEFSTENEEELKNFFEVSDNLLEDAAVNPSKISKRNFKYNKFRNSNQQFVGLVGNSKDIILEINHFKAVNEDEKVVQINVERLFAYSSPYLFMIKKIINQFDLIKEKDKEFLWKRIELLLSATQFVNKNSESNSIVENTLQLDDPIELICTEFKTVFKAYNITNNFIFCLTDFRGLENSEIIKTISFINIIFNDINIIKFLILFNNEEYNKLDSKVFQYIQNVYEIKNY